MSEEITYAIEDEDKFQPVRLIVLHLNYTTNGPKNLWHWIQVIWNYDIFIQDKIPFLKSLILANVVVWALL